MSLPQLVDTSKFTDDELRTYLRDLGLSFRDGKLTEFEYNHLLNKALGITEAERDPEAEEAYERRRRAR